MRHKEIFRAVQTLTHRWLGEIPPDASTVVSGVGVWPLLGLLADAADGPGRRQLADAIGIPASQASSAVPVVLDALNAVPAVRTALAFWHLRTVPIELSWEALLPPDALGELTGDPSADQAAVDRWVSGSTDGLIKALAVRLTPETEFVLASAILVRTRWLRPFTDDFLFRPESGPWRGRTLFALTRRTHHLERVRVVSTRSGTVTCLELPGSGGIDVHLALGEQGRTAAEVMQAAATVIRSARPAAALSIGVTAPGLTVESVPSQTPDDFLSVRLPRFSINAEHDLLRLPQIFGLDAVADRRCGHFPGISPRPLAVQAARQDATATFTAKGFEAAAVTAVGAAAGGRQVPPRRAKRVEVLFDRPFGFFAVDRRSGLILVAGWVNDPEAWDPQAAFDDIVDIRDLFPE